MTQAEKAKQFAALHIKGTPLILFNAWDAGTAKVIQSAGAKAIATSSWSVAEAQGFRDGEHIPLSFVEQIIARITATVDLPVTVDFEGGYSEDDVVLAKNVSRLIDLGVIGINFEDRVVQGDGLYAPDRQAQRIAAVRDTAKSKMWTSSSMRARICSLVTAIRRNSPRKPSSEQNSTKTQAHLVSSYRVLRTMA